MKVVFILFDSLNRNALSCYNEAAPHTPNFDRLANRGTRFQNHYVGSLPCMPARRDLLTGRLNFLHRSWGPVEPYDVCFPSLLRQRSVYTHLISDHYHYWEQGGCGYHNEYSSAEFVRGQERDLWKAMVEPPTVRFREKYHRMLSDAARRFPNMVNREFIRDEAQFPIVQCVDLALEFLQLNHKADNWLLQLELFDPHEPFTAPARFRKNLATQYDGPVLDWPLYDKLQLSDAEADELRANYLALVAMCDHYLGKLLDAMDDLALWQDTAIILTTDHGFLLGEKSWWGKNRMPAWDPIAHIPLLLHHPHFSPGGSYQAQCLTQCLDVTTTLLDLFDVTPPATMEGNSLLPAMTESCTVRDHALFGIFGGALNVTDGRHVYYRYPLDSDRAFYEYTLMPVHPASYFTAGELEEATLARGFSFAQRMPLLRMPARDDARRPPMQGGALAEANTVLYDLHSDPGQCAPLSDPATEKRLADAMTALMRNNEAPPELFRRFDLTGFS